MAFHRILLSFLPLLLFSPPLSCSPLARDSSVCAKTHCGAGRECVSTDRGEPVCHCLRECDPSEHWVCGSNSKSYRNHCELHRDACVTQTKIHLAHGGHCLEESTRNGISPLVCSLADRDLLRSTVMEWVEEEAGSAQNASKSHRASANGVLHKYFQTYDNGDSQFDSSEFLRFLRHNETALNLTHTLSVENNLLLRSLCVDALIELSDENADWKLSLAEFVNCLTPSYQPPDRKCALEDEVFEDGAETQMECNKCVCACGNWVCTALTCDGEQRVMELDRDGGEEEEEEMTEEEWMRRVAELNVLHVG